MSLYTILSLFMIIICILDICKVIDLSKKWCFITYMFFMTHLQLLWFHFWISKVTGNSSATTYLTVTIFAIATVIFQLYTTLRLHFQSVRKNKTDNPRINIIYSGRNLIQCGLWGLYLLAVWYIVCYFVLPTNPYQELIGHTFSFLPSVHNTAKAIAALSFEAIYAVIFIWLFLINGCLRIFFGSRNLIIGKRVFILLFMWVPIVQLYLAHIMCRAAKDEYLVTVSRSKQEAFTKTDELCQTQYPIVMVHGIGFRDLQYFNYWGRIPQILQQHGAKVYYGHQNAWGTIEDNAAAIAKVVDTALSENNCEKVNIIAHSKGGLDCRYLITSMGYANKVASLTTINTPHRGSELITLLNKLPDYVYQYIAKQLNKPFLLAGDTKPDCYAASKQLDPVFCAEFNQKNPDADGVYYQSYTSVMKNLFSDSLLWLPYFLMCTQKGRQNDGLVDASSAIWGDFKGILKSTNNRGISHGDMIDLKREDIKGFDVLKQFYDIVCELKNMGY